METFLPSDAIVIPGRCGHCFHNDCLQKWLKDHKKCPQCRATCSDKSLIRLFMDFASAKDLDEADTGRLIEKVDDLTYKMREKQMEIDRLENEVAKFQGEGRKQRKLIDALDVQVTVQKTIAQNLKEENQMLKVVNRSVATLETENRQLKEKVDKMRAIDDLLTSSAAETEDLLKTEKDTRVLATMLVNLKRELVASSKQMSTYRERLQNTAKEHRNDMKIKAELEKKVKELEAELHVAKSERPETPVDPKTPQASTSIEITTKKSRFKVESLRKPLGTPDSVNQILDSQSPYFNVKSSSVGLAPLQRPAKRPHPAEKREISILKNPRLEVSVCTSKPNYHFNGFGGSSRIDHTDFPRRDFGVTVKKLTKKPSFGPSSSTLSKESSGDLDKFLIKIR